jgi:hypothetical protein
MTRKIAACCFAAMFGLSVASAGAQTPSSPQTPPSQPPSTPTSPYPSAQSPTSEKSGKDMKLTGCVSSGTETGTYELTNIKKGMKHDMGSPSASASEPSSQSPSAMSSDKRSVKLMAASGVDLAPHVGHTVEVTGKWSPSAGSASESAPAASTRGMGHEFTVSNVKMVSSTCSGGTN